MSVFYESAEDVDALAENIIERAEQQDVVHQIYKYAGVSNNPKYRNENTVQGNYSCSDWFD